MNFNHTTETLSKIMNFNHTTETLGKIIHDPYSNMDFARRCIWVPGPIIVGAGPSGLAVAACLRSKGVPSLILERSSCIASLWQLKTYDRLKLHLPKQFCQLPLMPFPKHFPMYPTKHQFIDYLERYAKKFDIRPVFEQKVLSCEFDGNVWRVRTEGEEYVSRWVIAATGENADASVPYIEGMEGFGVDVVHTSGYKSGRVYEGKKVLVVGCGNSGMEVCLDLCNSNACPSLVVRDAVHILPRDMFGRSTFGLSMWLLKWLPIRMVDRFLLMMSWFRYGDMSRFGLDRPELGPLELKSLTGKTPVLDVGTLDKIKSGDIKICPGIKRLKHKSVEFTDGRTENFDAIILATGYKSNVPSWLKESGMFSEKDGLPKKPFPNGWKGESGLYAVGFTKRGLLGASMDAKNIADDIEMCLKNEAKQYLSTIISRPSLLQKHQS